MYTRCSEYEYFWKSKQTSRFKDGVVKLKGAFEGKNVEHSNMAPATFVLEKSSGFLIG
jgi:hypothetical protein